VPCRHRLPLVLIIVHGTTRFQKVKGATTIVLDVVVVVTTQAIATIVALFVHMQPS
jgi:hypothetical protein